MIRGSCTAHRQAVNKGTAKNQLNDHNFLERLQSVNLENSSFPLFPDAAVSLVRKLPGMDIVVFLAEAQLRLRYSYGIETKRRGLFGSQD